ncbi:coiled-coil domain-containing protein 124 [Octopus bimaculoides]|uniref:Coiled-coil domain-containing protein n=1 Tax=Octopus bimaculoides TaxID=37653 RepID=A0A0L8HK60_OCTBM|nr:coiled-coil domain-containing protein 124 [Octopus bimaculoides]XP_052828033.1 coiled-coil domain-containing protein 124 [Octopus bimaculoides]|eukprot:XP_014772001.1 PREDICTED: coiled-coil domain-containing protein 124-like [Octopus bimaculoides]
MPKKFQGENSKAVQARVRKEAKRQEEIQRKNKEAEDKLWEDNDKNSTRKQQRKEDRDRKRIETLERKQQLKQLHDEEMNSLKGKTSVTSNKITRAQIEGTLIAQATPKKRETSPDFDLPPLEENLNRAVTDSLEARTVDEALSLLSVKEPDVDRHPEKRVKAAYNKFEERRLPILKQENPNMRLSQLKHMLKKEWMKSSENPMIQCLSAN